MNHRILSEITLYLCSTSPGAFAVQILLIFLQKMDLLLTKTPPEEIKNCVLPMIYRALEAPSVQIQVQFRAALCWTCSSKKQMSHPEK